MSTGLVTRRRFVIGGTVAGGALALGFLAVPAYLDARRRREIEALAERTGAFRPNAWLTIEETGEIVFRLDRVEMGQGTYTSHTMLIAEELEVDPAAVTVRFADAARHYDNPEFGVQITGGSTSVKGSWEPLGLAGATAREMLRAAAAARWGVPIAECPAAGGEIVHEPSGRRLAYGELTREAARQPIPSPALKRPEAYTVIGREIGRLDAELKSTGRAVFGIDVDVPEALTAVVIRPPVLGARVQAIDAAAALQRPRVHDVFEVPTGVAVVAEGYWHARQAAGQVQVEWAGGRPETDSAAMAEALRAATAEPGESVRDEGDVEAGFGQGEIVEAVYTVPHLAHAPMEPLNCTARVADGACEVWAPTQSPGVARERISTALGLHHSRVTVHTTFLGGGFGRRLITDEVVEAALVAQRLGRPVQVIWSREDDVRHGVYRPAVVHALRGAVTGAGRVSAWRHRIASPSILSSLLPQWLPAMTPDATPDVVNRAVGGMAGGVFGGQWMSDMTSTEGAADLYYDLPNLRVELAQVDPGVPIGFWRSVGHSHTAFAVESFIDELARATGADPYHFRRRLLERVPRALRVLDRAAQRADWGRELPPGVFQGIAQHRSFDTWVAEVAEVSVTDGRVRVHRVVCAVDCGRVVNPDIVRSQIESGVVWGLSAALKQWITYEKGQVAQSNFHDYPMLRMNEMPRIEVVIVESDADPTGVGEPGVPPIAPAVTNAIAAATGRRIRTLPIGEALG